MDSPNGDEVKRKIPMQIVIQPIQLHSDIENMSDFYSSMDKLIAHGYRFTPVLLLAQPHYCIHPINVQVIDPSITQSSRPIKWIFIEDNNGFIQLQRTLGMIVVIDNDGILRLRSKEQRRPDNDSFIQINHWYENN